MLSAQPLRDAVFAEGVARLAAVRLPQHVAAERADELLVELAHDIGRVELAGRGRGLRRRRHRQSHRCKTPRSNKLHVVKVPQNRVCFAFDRFSGAP